MNRVWQSNVTSIIALGIAVLGPSAHADRFAIDKNNSLLAVVTHKGGVGAALAHDHLIAATGYDYELTVDDDDPATCEFTMTAPVAKLMVDDPPLKSQWAALIKKHGILADALSAISTKNRSKIRKHMLAKDQLHAEAHPQLSLKVRSIEEKNRPENESFPHCISLALTVRGKTIEREIPGRLIVEGEILQVEAVGEFKFSEFGIKPYTAFLGAIRNHDTFHLYANVTAKRARKEKQSVDNNGGQNLARPERG